MKKQLILISSFLLLIFSLAGFTANAQEVIRAGLDFPIDKGVITGDFSIQFMDLDNVVLKPNTPFSLSALGISSSTVGDAPGNDIKSFKKRLNATGLKGYHRVQITRPNDPTVYYGILCFYGTTARKAKKEAVAQSYQINIPDAYFNDCKGGNVAKQYEYWVTASNYRCPTWLILFSDSKSLMWN